MTEIDQKTYESELRDALGDAVFTKAQWQGRTTDWMIQWFAEFVTSTDGSDSLELPLTLTVGGNLISGTLISEAAYFDQLAADFSGAMPESAKDAAKEMIKSLQPPPLADGEAATPRQFLHMKDAQVFTSASKPILNQGVLWRGKISSVEGFSLGNITPS